MHDGTHFQHEDHLHAHKLHFVEKLLSNNSDRYSYERSDWRQNGQSAMTYSSSLIGWGCGALQHCQVERVCRQTRDGESRRDTVSKENCVREVIAVHPCGWQQTCKEFNKHKSKLFFCTNNFTTKYRLGCECAFNVPSCAQNWDTNMMPKQKQCWCACNYSQSPASIKRVCTSKSIKILIDLHSFSFSVQLRGEKEMDVLVYVFYGV